jgi:putative nucleotidyltransferase with HDIG domain
MTTFSTETSSNSQQMKSTRSDLLKQYLDSFPVLPETVMRLMTVVGDPESSRQDVVEAILPDPSLCLSVLKIANSALFGRPKKVDTMRMAVTILGFNEVQRIALTKALLNSFSKIPRQHKPAVDRFWTHSFVAGMAARTIALDLKVAPDLAFMGGLIHDIGKLIMLETFAVDYSPEEWMTKISDEEVLSDELNMFSFTHDIVGGQLLRKWLFPDSLISAVASHHRPSEATEEKAFAHIIQLADVLSFYCCNRELPEAEDILPAIENSLPDIKDQWADTGLSYDDREIVKWFSWLLKNHNLGDSLLDAFSS